MLERVVSTGGKDNVEYNEEKDVPRLSNGGCVTKRKRKRPDVVAAY